MAYSHVPSKFGSILSTTSVSHLKTTQLSALAWKINLHKTASTSLKQPTINKNCHSHIQASRNFNSLHMRGIQLIRALNTSCRLLHELGGDCCTTEDIKVSTSADDGEDYGTTVQNNISSSSKTSELVEDRYSEFVRMLPTLQSGSVHMQLNNKSGVAVITLDNPSSLNALSGSMMQQLSDITSLLEMWDQGKAVILVGANGNFCSGGDRNMLSKHLNTGIKGGYMARYMHAVTERFSELPLISVAAIQGKALGGGAELTTMCDYRLLEQDAEVRFVQTRMGITCGWGGGSRLTLIVGKRMAMRLMLGSKIVDFEKGISMGLVDGSIDKDNPVDSAYSWLKTSGLLQHPHLVHSVKRTCLSAESDGIHDAYQKERLIFEQHWGGQLHKQALSNNIKHR